MITLHPTAALQHPAPCFLVGQRVYCWGVSKLNGHVIYGVRLTYQVEDVDGNNFGFATEGWEYRLGYEHKTGHWREWGWVSEAELLKCQREAAERGLPSLLS